LHAAGEIGVLRRPGHAPASGQRMRRVRGVEPEYWGAALKQRPIRTRRSTGRWS
jgi:hypothetical protein